VFTYQYVLKNNFYIDHSGTIKRATGTISAYAIPGRGVTAEVSRVVVRLHARGSMVTPVPHTVVDVRQAVRSTPTYHTTEMFWKNIKCIILSHNVSAPQNSLD